jgi:hypothetical protein
MHTKSRSSLAHAGMLVQHDTVKGNQKTFVFLDVHIVSPSQVKTGSDMISSDRGHKIPFGIVLCQSSQALIDDCTLSLGCRVGDIAGGGMWPRAGLVCAEPPTASATACELSLENRDCALAMFD